MASIVPFLQNELVVLSTEAKKKHPDIKDAAERVILILRPLKDRPLADACADLAARSDDLLLPFLLACDTKQPKLASIALGALQRLAAHRAVADHAPTLRKVIHAISDVASAVAALDVQIKALQTLLPIMTGFVQLHDDLVAETLNICFRLTTLRDPLLSNTAAATLRQLVIFLFDKVPLEDGTDSSVAADLGRVRLVPSSLDSLRPCARDAYLVFVDLCRLAGPPAGAQGHEPTSFLGVSTLARPLTLELLESVLANHAAVFARHIEFSTVLATSVCPMAIRAFPDRSDFSVNVRLTRVVLLLIKEFHSMLAMECEVFLSLLLRAASTEQDPLWARSIALEVLVAILSKPQLVAALFSAYDQQKSATDVVKEMANGIHKVVAQGTAASEQSGVKVQCLDQLDKSDPPFVPDDYLLHLANQCVLVLVSSLVELARPVPVQAQAGSLNHSRASSMANDEPLSETGLGDMPTPPPRLPSASASLSRSVTGAGLTDPAVLAALVNAVWPALLASLSHMLATSSDAIAPIAAMAVVSARAHLPAPRDAFLTLLCRAVTSIPLAGGGENPASAGTLGVGTNPPITHAGSSTSAMGGSSNPAGGVSAVGGSMSAAAACMHAALRALDQMMHAGPDTLDVGAWFLVLEAACHWERARIGARTNVGSTSGGAAAVAANSGGSASSLPTTASVAAAMANNPMMMAAKRAMTPTSPTSVAGALPSISGAEKEDADAVLRNLLSATRELSDEALVPIFSALCQFSTIPTMTFAVEKLRQIVIIHLPRLLTSLSEQWTLVIHHFVFIASTTQSIELQLLACDTICHVAAQGIHQAQAKVLLPLCELAALTGDVPKRALHTLHALLQVHGQSITEWPIVYGILQSSATEDALVRIAFPSLELVCSEYLPTSPEELDMCIETLRIYACQSADTNIALTCIRLLWAVADSSTARKTHWLRVLSQLTIICKDRRPQVRNGCATSLFRAVAAGGARLTTADQWDLCIRDVVLPVLESTLLTCGPMSAAHPTTDDTALLPSEQPAIVHHSRDTAEKQWDETRVLSVQGLGALYSSEGFRAEVFPRHMVPLLDMTARYILETTLEVRLATARVFSALAADSYTASDPVWQALFSTWTRTVDGLREQIASGSGAVEEAPPSAISKGSKPRKLISHDFFHLLAMALRSLLPGVAPMRVNSATNMTGSTSSLSPTTATIAPVPAGRDCSWINVGDVVGQLERLVQMAAKVADHPNDTESLSPVQEVAVETADALCTAAASLGYSGASSHVLIGLLSRMARLSLTTTDAVRAPGCKYPTYLALARVSMNKVVSLVGVDATTPDSDPVFAGTAVPDFLGSVGMYIGVAHALHDTARETMLALVRICCRRDEDASTCIVPALVTHALAVVVIRYLESRPSARAASEELDVAALTELADHVPAALVEEDLAAFLHAVEVSSRIHAPSALDATVASALAAALPPADITTAVSAPSPPPAAPAAAEADLHAAAPGTPQPMSPLGLSLTREPVREKYAAAALATLFALIPKYPVPALPVVLQRSRTVLGRYVDDATRRPGIPLARMREVEVVSVLQHLAQLEAHVPGDKDPQHSAPHLEAMYSELVGSIMALRGNPVALEWVCMCLARVGKSRGLGDQQRSG
ncbi:hypothetical protein BC828DRAFT_403606 [Blastocladiella britannica]|nr:hypothetical protein BC828DRAFT_403606 [Blastocladiella britannica]